MKLKLMLLLSLLPMLLFVGCEKYGSEPIVGSWRLLSYTYENGLSTPVPSVESSYCLCFNGDGSFRGNGYINTFWGEFSLEKNRITINIDRMTQVDAGSANMQEERKFIDALKQATYCNVSGGSLMLKFGGNMMTFKRESVIIPTN